MQSRGDVESESCGRHARPSLLSQPFLIASGNEQSVCLGSPGSFCLQGSGLKVSL